MNTPMSLKEFVERMKSTGNDEESILALVQDKRVEEFTKSVSEAGTAILQPLAEKDIEYIKGAITFVQSGVLAEMLARSTNSAEMIRVFGLVGSEEFFNIITLALKYSVGLAVVEELR